MTVKDAKNCRKEYAKHRPEQEREIEMQSQQIARKRKRNTNYCLDRSASLIVTKDDLLNYLLRCMFDPAGHKGGPSDSLSVLKALTVEGPSAFITHSTKPSMLMISA